MKLKGSSLVESVIAIAIISICILIASLVYMNVVSKTNSVAYYNALQQVDLLAVETVTQTNYENETFNYPGCNIEKEVVIDKADGTALLKFRIKIGTKTHEVDRLVLYHEN